MDTHPQDRTNFEITYDDGAEVQTELCDTLEEALRFYDSCAHPLQLTRVVRSPVRVSE